MCRKKIRVPWDRRVQKQIRLMAELAEETDETRSAELLRELLLLDQLIQTGLAELWNIPSRSERSD